jgi:hypothetical protein
VRKRVIPDVHVALHFKRFDQIDWCKVVDADAVTLVIAPPFMSELDDKKNGSKGNLQKRARSVSAWLGGRLDDEALCELSERVRLVFLSDEPELSVDFAAHRLVPTNLDDRYIACLIAEREQYPDVEVVFVTTDNIAKAKARARAIKYVEPPADAKLNDEPDEQERENAELRKKLAAYVNNTSDLRLSFRDGKQHIDEEVARPRVPPPEVGRDLRQHDMRYHLLFEQHGLYTHVEPLAPKFKPRAQYLNERRDWLQAYFDIASEHARTLLIQFTLTNSGRAPAERIRVDMTLPDGVSVRVRQLRAFPEPPRMLVPPRFSVGRSAMENLSSQHAIVPSGEPTVRLIVDPTDRQRFSIEIDHLNHQDEIALPLIHLSFPSTDAIKSFSVKYRILSATQPNPASGELHLKLTPKDVALRYPDDPEEDPRAPW